MLLSLVIIVALIWAAVIGNIYSNFLVFYSNFAETENYNKAYYASIAGIERAELITKQRQPWFEHKWGWNSGSSIGRWSDWPINNNFSYLSRDSNINSSSRWRIDSLTNRIPSMWKGDVDKKIATGDSTNYNMMNYNESEIFLLYHDPINFSSEDSNPYEKLEKNDMIRSKLTNISGTIRLPNYLYNTFWKLDIQNWLVWDSNEKDDVIVDRQVIWKYKNNSNQTNQFTIFSTQKTSHGNPVSEDTTIRESDINDDGLQFKFQKESIDEPYNDFRKRTIISPDSDEIRNFEEVFTGDNFSQVQIKFSLLNQLKTSVWNIYPFLEYFVELTGDKIPDKYYTINSFWNYWDYEVNLTIQKLTIKESILKSFTTIF